MRAPIRTAGPSGEGWRGRQAEADRGAAAVALVAQTSPPWRSTICCTIARPRPEPGSVRAVVGAVEAVEHVGQVAGAMPRPWSRTSRLGPSTATSMAVPGGLYFTALSTRLEMARSIIRGRTLTWRCPSCGDGDRAARCGARPGRRPSAASSAEVDRLRLLVGRRPVGRQLDQLGDEVGELVDLDLDARAARPAAARRGSSGPAASSSTLVRRLVSGVRSSWLASVTRRCCCSRDVASASTIVVKLCGRGCRSRPGRPPGSASTRSCVAAMSLRRVPQPLDRPHDAPGQEPAEQHRGDRRRRG